MREAMRDINGARVRTARDAEVLAERAVDSIPGADATPLYDELNVIQGFLIWQSDGRHYVALIQRGFLNIREFSSRADAVAAAALCDVTVYDPASRVRLRYAP